MEPLIYPLYTSFEWSKNTAREITRTWNELFGLRRPEALASGITLFREQTLPSEVFLLVDGLVLLTCTSPEWGSECILGVRFPGQIIEHCAHNLRMPYPVSATVLVRSQILRVSISALRKHEQENPQTAAFFQRLLALDLYHATLFIMQLKKAAPANRLKRFLHLLASVMGSEPKSGRLQIAMPLHDNQIAEVLGFSPRQLKRVKRQLHDQGYLHLSRGRLWSFPENHRV